MSPYSGTGEIITPSFELLLVCPSSILNRPRRTTIKGARSDCSTESPFPSSRKSRTRTSSARISRIGVFASPGCKRKFRPRRVRGLSTLMVSVVSTCWPGSATNTEYGGARSISCCRPPASTLIVAPCADAKEAVRATKIGRAERRTKCGMNSSTKVIVSGTTGFPEIAMQVQTAAPGPVFGVGTTEQSDVVPTSNLNLMRLANCLRRG